MGKLKEVLFDKYMYNEAIGMLQIIPMDLSGNIYSKYSCKLQIPLLSYDDYMAKYLEEYLPKVLFPKYYTKCTIVQEDNLKNVVLLTRNKFSSEYRFFMNELFEKIKESYSDIFSFDGSRIISNETYGENIFNHC